MWIWSILDCRDTARAWIPSIYRVCHYSWLVSTFVVVTLHLEIYFSLELCEQTSTIATIAQANSPQTRKWAIPGVDTFDSNLIIFRLLYLATISWKVWRKLCKKRRCHHQGGLFPMLLWQGQCPPHLCLQPSLRDFGMHGVRGDRRAL